MVIFDLGASELSVVVHLPDEAKAVLAQQALDRIARLTEDGIQIAFHAFLHHLGALPEVRLVAAHRYSDFTAPQVELRVGVVERTQLIL